MAFDVITPAQMGRGSVPLIVGLFYTVPPITLGMVKNIDISNNEASPVNVTVYLVPSGDSPGITNILVPGVKILGNGMFQWSGIENLNAGDAIHAIATATGVSINMSGGEAI